MDQAKYQREIAFILQHTGVGPEGARVLDVGCGTGTHASILIEKGSSVAGVDLNEGMLRVARTKCPKANWIQGDMRSLALHREFDLVLCMYGAINYVDREDGLRQTMENLLRHARPGGFVIIETRWARTIPDQETIDDFDGLLVVRKWSKGRGIGGSDIYALGVLDRKDKLFSLDLHNLYFQDPFKLADVLRGPLGAAGEVAGEIRGFAVRGFHNLTGEGEGFHRGAQ